MEIIDLRDKEHVIKQYVIDVRINNGTITDFTFAPLTFILSPRWGADLSTHLTQGVEDVIGGTCMFVVNIFRNPSWIGFKRLSEQSPLFRGSICRDGFANG